VKHLPPGIPGTIVRTTLSLIFTAAALAGWLWLLFAGQYWAANAEGLTAVVLGLLYTLMRVGGMGRCSACKRVVPALWGGSYCRSCEGWVRSVDRGWQTIQAWAQLVGMHGKDRVDQLVAQYGQTTVLRMAMHGVGSLPESVSAQERRELREFLGHEPLRATANRFGVNGAMAPERGR
jgi:hypothetical protein